MIGHIAVAGRTVGTTHYRSHCTAINQPSSIEGCHSHRSKPAIVTDHTVVVHYNPDYCHNITIDLVMELLQQLVCPLLAFQS